MNSTPGGKGRLGRPFSNAPRERLPQASEEGRSERAGSSSNTNLPNFGSGAGLALPNAPKSLQNYTVLHKGIDTGEWSYKVNSDELDTLLDAFLSFLGQGEQNFDGMKFVVTRMGGLTHHYVVSFADGLRLLLPDREFSRYGVKVTCGAKLCVTTLDLQRLVVERLAWALVGAVSPATVQLVDASRLSLGRLDACLDVLMPEKEFQRLCKLVAVRDQRVVTRARNREHYGDDGRFTGFRIGAGKKSVVLLRCYDKKEEAVQGKDWSFWSEVYGRGGAFDVPDGMTVARFEWQLRRDFLQGWADFSTAPDGGDDLVTPHPIVTVADFHAVAGSVFGYLCNKWFRLAGQPSGENHERRTLPLWSRITAAFLSGAWSSFSPGLRRRLKRHVAANLGRLAEMALGCMASIAAIIGHNEQHGRPAGFRDVSMALRRHIGNDSQKWLASASRRYAALQYNADWRRVPVSPVGY